MSLLIQTLIGSKTVQVARSYMVVFVLSCENASRRNNSEGEFFDTFGREKQTGGEEL